MKTFKLGLVIGRFNHLHSKHEYMINTALNSCNKVLLLVGSSQESGTVRNPFSLHTRMNMIRKVYSGEISDNRLLLAHIDDLTHEDDHSKEWGKFLLNKIDMWRGHYGINEKLDCMIYGNDEERMSWFDEETKKKIGQIILPRDDNSLSATKVRELIAKNAYDNWFYAVNSVFCKSDFNNLQEELLAVDYYKNINKGVHNK